MTDLPGAVLVEQGRLLLSNLGPNQRSIYVFPTTLHAGYSVFGQAR